MRIRKAKCKHCKKQFESLYEKQLDYNLRAHELSCKKKGAKK